MERAKIEMRFPSKSAGDLEWQRLLEQLAKRSTGDEAAERCRALPFLDPGDALKRLSSVQEFSRCIEKGDLPPSLPARPVAKWLSSIRTSGEVPREALIDISANLKLFAAIAQYLENRKQICKGNAALVLPEDGSKTVLSLVRLAAEIDSSFEPDGSFSDSASPELADLRRKVAALRKRMISKIEKIAEAEQDLLQDRNFTLRNDRFVLPVRSDAHRRFAGIVHGSSGSGATIYVEPEQIVELGNDLMLAHDNVAREEARILSSLCDAVRDQLDEVARSCESIVDVEVRIAAARLARDLKATSPNDNLTGAVNLVEARHPLLLLDGVDVVPCSISAEPGLCIVISGPNAGGKTVVLKTVGLICLMLSAGLPVPVHPDSSLGIPLKVLTDIGDDQSLERNLSTFSAHMTNIASILKSATKGTIVLLDEIAVGTDPTEGAALAEALLTRLAELGATVFATTHFDTLKARAQAGQRFANAAVGFDIERMQPTFELRMGTPGSSSALAVARRFGIPNEVVDKAKSAVPNNVHALADAVEALESERRRARIERQFLTDSRIAADKELRRYKEEMAKLRAKQEKAVDKDLDALAVAVKKAREIIRNVETRIRRRRIDAESLFEARGAVEEVARRLDLGGDLRRDSGDGPVRRAATESDIAPGARLFVKSLGSDGIVDSELKDGKVRVNVGKIATRVKLQDLCVTIDRAKEVPVNRAPAALSQTSHQEARKPAKSNDNTLDVRGMTSEEAVEATDSFLDRALRNELDVVFIVHGYGTGALRQAVRVYLKDSRYIKGFWPCEPDHGGDGVTMAALS